MSDIETPGGEVASDPDIEPTDAAEAEAAEIEPEEETEVDDGQSDDEAVDGDEDDDAEPEAVSVEVAGEKFDLPPGTPKELRDQIQAKFTGFVSKTNEDRQAVAEKAKLVEAREQAVDLLSNLNDEVMTSYSRGLALRDELSKLQQIDQNALWQSNPDQARRLSDTIQQKQAQFNQIVQQVGQAEANLVQQRQQQQEALTSQQAEIGAREVEKAIPGFKDKHASQVVEYVQREYGISEADAKNWALSPGVTKMAYKAMRYDQLQAKAKPQPPKPAAAQPVKAIKGKGAAKATTNPDKMSVDEWMRQRNKQTASR